MKTLTSIILTLIIFATTSCINKSNIENKQNTDIVDKKNLTETNLEFIEYINLFEKINLPYPENIQKTDRKKIPENYVQKFIIPINNDYIEADDFTTLGKFQIQDKFFGIIFSFWITGSGYLQLLVIYDNNNQIVSDFIIGIDNGSYIQDFYIDNQYNLTISETSEVNPEERIKTEYIIKNGMIQKK